MTDTTGLTRRFGVRLPHDLANWVDERADAEHRNRTQQILHILQEARNAETAA